MSFRNRLKKRIKRILPKKSLPSKNPQNSVTYKQPVEFTHEYQKLVPPRTDLEVPFPPIHQQVNISSENDDTWVSDYLTEDAPIRNAHYRPQVDQTSNPFTIQITTPEGESIEFECETNEFILDAADRAGKELPFSCRSGGCLVCTGRLTNGEANMSEQYVLEEEHIADRFILLCCSKPTSDLEILSHQESNVD
jgi:ferredoxin